jgi:hypothetical protein
MQKPPEIRRLALRSECSAVLDHDRRDDEDLSGERDNAGGCSFKNTHDSFPLVEREPCFAPAPI